MSIFPPLPPYEGLHPLVVHFPIALFIAAPVFVILAILWRKQAPMWYSAALVVLLLATLGAFLAVATGEAAEDSAKRVATAKATLDRHEELAELARNAMLGVTILGAALVGVAWWRREKIRAPIAWGLGLFFLVAHAGAALALMKAAHEGGRLVHEFSVHAPTATMATAPASLEKVDARHNDHDD